MINLIVAMDEKGAIGKNGTLPWPFIGKDMAWFRKHTKGHAVVMGYKTWISLPDPPLPHRTNYVATRDYHKYDWKTVPDGYFSDVRQDILDFGYFPGVTQLFIIGGAEIYRQTLDIVDKIYLTNVYGEYEGDTFLPELALALGDFHLDYEEEVPGKCKFEIWKRDTHITTKME